MSKPNPRDLSVLAQEAKAKKLIAIVGDLFDILVEKGLKLSDAVVVADVLQKKIAQSSQKAMVETDLSNV